jgi:hypothetical protein
MISNSARRSTERANEPAPLTCANLRYPVGAWICMFWIFST